MKDIIKVSVTPRFDFILNSYNIVINVREIIVLMGFDKVRKGGMI